MAISRGPTDAFGKPITLTDPIAKAPFPEQPDPGEPL